MNRTSLAFVLAVGVVSFAVLALPEAAPAASAPRATPGPDVVIGSDFWSPVQYLTSTTTIQASWQYGEYPESSIAAFEWAIGTGAGSADIQPFTNVGMAYSAGNSGLTLVQGQWYY